MTKNPSSAFSLLKLTLIAAALGLSVNAYAAGKQQLRPEVGKLSPYENECFIGGSEQEQQYALKNIHAGGVSFDDVMLHSFMQDLPFGGVGESGMGRYGGHVGFKTFSNAKSVAHRPWSDVMRYMAPPFTARMSRTIRAALKL